MSETYDALVAAAEAIYPEPHAVRPERPAERSRRMAARSAEPGERVVTEYAVVPSRARPRIVVPAGDSQALAAALGRTSDDSSWRARVSRRALAAACRAPLAGRALARAAARDRLVVTAPRGGTTGIPSLQGRLAELLDRDVALSFGVGSARANRKPILQVTEARTSRTLAFVKLGTSEVGRALVHGEAEALRQFHDDARSPTGQGLPGSVVAPDVLAAESWNGLELLAVSPLRARRWGRPRTPAVRDALLRGAMRQLAERFGTSQARLVETPFWQGIRAGEAVRVEPRFGRTTETIERRHGDTLLELGAWHGDWTPWNMAWDRDRVLLWDFERFARGVPTWFDAEHWRVQTALRRAGERRTAALLADAEWPTLLYLVELARRWVEASTPPAGAPLRPRTRWLLDLLDDLAARAPAARPEGVRR